MNETKLVLEVPTWILVVALAFYAIDLLYGAHRALQKRRERKAEEAISDYVPPAVSQ